MESLTWTQDHTWGVSTVRESGCGSRIAMVLGTLMTIVLCLVLGLSWWWAIVSYVGAFPLGKAVGLVLTRRLRVHTMVFTPSAVRLVRSTSTLVVDIAQVVEIEVRHSRGPVDHRRTTVELTYAKPPVALGVVGISNWYDSDLAGRLGQLLGPDVPIREQPQLS